MFDTFALWPSSPASAANAVARSVVPAMLAIIIVAPRAEAQFTARILETQPGAPVPTFSEARAIGSGRVVCDMLLPDYSTRAAMINPDGTITSLHPTLSEWVGLGLPDWAHESARSSVRAISPSGQRQAVYLAYYSDDVRPVGTAVRTDGTPVTWSLRLRSDGFPMDLTALSNTQEGGTSLFSDWGALLWSGAGSMPVDLRPGTGERSVLGMSASQQVGAFTDIDSRFKAVLWTGSAASAVILHPAGATSSIAFATDGLTQGGQASDRACKWQGTAASFVDLHPSGLPGKSYVAAVDEGFCAGSVGATYFNDSSDRQAWLWTPTNAWINLHAVLPPPPPGEVWTSSHAAGVEVTGATVRVVGWASFTDASSVIRSMAVEWTGTLVPENVSWTTTRMHPSGAQWSYIRDVRPGEQVGNVRTSNIWRAAKWSGSPASYVELSPPNTSAAECSATDGSRQAGSVQVTGGTGYRATLWNGSAPSAIDITPPIAGLTSAFIGDASDGMQVGSITVPNPSGSGNVSRAGLWRGSANSWVSLHPSIWTQSNGYGTDGVSQVGAVWPATGNSHAALWRGTAGSFVDLDPGNVVQSFAEDVDGDEQVGLVITSPFNLNAALWRGSAQSYVSLHPSSVPVADGSWAYDVHRGVQVGIAGNRAAMWQGTAASYLNLHQFLPPVYSQSRAFAVWKSPSEIIIGGEALNSSTGVWEAMLWRRGCFSITSEPVDEFSCAGSTVSFGVGLEGDQNLYSLQWLFNGSAIDPLTNPSAVTGTLMVVANNATIGQYTCVITSDGCAATTYPATLSICSADFDCNSGVDFQDIFAFLNAWFSSNPNADFDGLNAVDIQDIFAFLNAWFAGC